jgi:hypothetical protein
MFVYGFIITGSYLVFVEGLAWGSLFIWCCVRFIWGQWYLVGSGQESFMVHCFNLQATDKSMGFLVLRCLINRCFLFPPPPPRGVH